MTSSRFSNSTYYLLTRLSSPHDVPFLFPGATARKNSLGRCPFVLGGRAMSRFVPSVRSASSLVALCLAVGCTAQVQPGQPASPVGAGSPATGSGGLTGSPGGVTTTPVGGRGTGASV